MLIRGLRIPIPCHGYGSTEDDLAELESMGGGGGGDDLPPDTPPAAPAAQQPPNESPAWQAPDFVMLGEERVPWDKAQTWLSQGRNFSQRMAELKQQREQFEPFMGLDPQLLNHFKQVNEFISSGEEGQQWWDHVNQSWQRRALPPEMDPNLEAVVAPLNQQISELSATVKDLIAEKTEREQMSQSQALEDDIKGVREKFANIDFEKVDLQTGLTLEQQIINYAAQHGHPNFRSAFLDYYHDKLMEIGKSDASAAQAAKTEAEARKGIVGRSPAPQKPDEIQSYDRSQGKSYDDLTTEALRELGIA